MNPEEVLEKYRPLPKDENGVVRELFQALEQAIALIAAINSMTGPDCWDLLVEEEGES